jgi:hypothetical protein
MKQRIVGAQAPLERRRLLAGAGAALVVATMPDRAEAELAVNTIAGHFKAA